MVKKIIHCADIHIRTYRMHDEYKQSFENFFNDCRTLTEGYEYDEVRIAIVGDLVHQKITISNEQLLLTAWLLDELSKIAPVVFVAGNHDLLENNKDRIDSLTPIVTLMTNDNITYLKESKCYLDHNIVWCNYSIFEENSRPDIESARSIYSEDKTYVGLYHAPIIGATTDLGYEFDEHHTNLEHFEGCDMVLLGDIHKRQAFNHKGIPIVYPSSLIQQGFGETVSNHGFLFWDVETRRYTEHNVANAHGFYQFSIKSLDDLETGSEILTNA